MNRKHVTGIALLLALGIVAGMFALVRTTGIAGTNSRAATDTLVLDKAVTIPIIALLVPGVSPYRPLAVGIDVLSAELVVVVYASFSQRKWIGVKNWRRLHYATYAVFGLATAHGFLAGTDTSRPWALGVYLAAPGAQG